MILFCLKVILTLSASANASPIPGMGSSALFAPDKNYVFNLKKFSLQAGDSRWELRNNEDLETEPAANALPQISMQFADPKSKAFLSVRSEDLASTISLDKYSKKWLHNYSLYGFDLLGVKEFTQNNHKGLVLDFTHPQKNKQLRQVIFLRDKIAVIMTCVNDKNQFSQSLPACNSIVKTFHWL